MTDLDSNAQEIKNMKQIDWDIIKELIESKEWDEVEVGLAEDWFWTSGVIVEKGKIQIKKDCFFGCSFWATPSVRLKKRKKEYIYECWKYGSKEKYPTWLKKLAREENKKIKGDKK